MNTFYKLQLEDINKLEDLIRLYGRVFEMKNFEPPTPKYLSGLLMNDQIIFYVALDNDGTIIGGLTAYIMPSTYYPGSEVYIYDLAVEERWQRKGIGKGLLYELKRYCKGFACRYIFVQADLADQHAIDFYLATGGLQEDVVHFDYKL